MTATIRLPLILLGLLASLAACNTVQGVGRDVQSGGQAISTVAQDVQEQI